MPPSIDFRSPDRRHKSRPPRTTPKKWKHNHIPADERSRASDSTPGAPSSVVLENGVPLVRDLSDLSGSYLGGNTAPRKTGSSVPKNVYQSDQSNTSYERPWRQARILSSVEPVHPQPPVDCGDSVGLLEKQGAVVMTRNGVIEVIHPHEAEVSKDTPFVPADDEEPQLRQPILLLLMDPGRKMYELMQLWINVTDDTVRDVLHAIQLNLGDKWRQDYDGLFQVRNQTFNQLIHILDVSKYDVQPFEVWVAKPWAMAAKATAGYAGALLDHLQEFKVVESVFDNGIRRGARPRTDESILVLSSLARSRMYVPDGILKHHHAAQFLSFSPPLEKLQRVDVLAPGSIVAADSMDEDGCSASQLSDSHYSPSITSEDVVPGKAYRPTTDLGLTDKPIEPRRSSPEASPRLESCFLDEDPPIIWEEPVVDVFVEDQVVELSPPRRGLFSFLNCGQRKKEATINRRKENIKHGSMATLPLGERSDSHWDVWGQNDNESMAGRSHASRPLLFGEGRPHRSDWSVDDEVIAVNKALNSQ